MTFQHKDLIHSAEQVDLMKQGIFNPHKMKKLKFKNFKKNWSKSKSNLR
jgi:hypothetical protein